MYKYQTIKAISLKLWSITHLYATSHWLKFQKRATNIILETRKIVICIKALNAVYYRIVMNVFHSENMKTHINIKHSRIVLFGIKRKKIDNFVPPGPSLPPDLRGSSKHLERYRPYT